MRCQISLVFIFFLFVSSFETIAQNRDNIWMLSYTTGSNVYFSCGIDFNSGVADTFSVNKKMKFFITNTSICDSTGELLFYTNGVYIANRNHDTLLNSDNFNPGDWTDFYATGGMGITQGAIILPKPNHPSQYLVFYETGKFDEFYDKLYGTEHLSMSEVDMTLDGGLGGIPADKKNIHLVDDTLIWGRLTACKHANGRDWWLITHKAYTNLYYKFLIQPDSIIGPIVQQIGSNIAIDKFGMACFSPDGSKFAHLSYGDTLDIFDFNRCDGNFSNHIMVELPDSLSTGCAFSPSNQFLYLVQPLHLYQMDMFATDIPSSLSVIASYDGWLDPDAANLPSWFLMPQLAPDNKIYIGPWNGIFILHVINEPDNPGLDCNFEQHSFKLPSNNVNIPSFPNYDLDSLDDSECDTVYSNSVNSLTANSFRIFPNPSTNWLYINYQLKQTAVLELFDSFGRVVKSITLYPYFKSRMLDVSNLHEGIYIATISKEGKRIWSEVILVQH